MHAVLRCRWCLPGLLAATLVHAADKPAVAVAFRLDVPVFRANFSETVDPETGVSPLGRFVAATTPPIIAALQGEIGFVRFSADATAPLQLDVALVGESTSNANLGQTYFVTTVRGLPAGVAPPEIKWPFRSDDELLEPIDPQSFPREVAAGFQRQLKANLQKVIDGFQVSVASEAVLIVDRDNDLIFCAFPVSYDELGANVGTTFAMVTRVSGPVQVQRFSFAEGTSVSPADVRGGLPPAFDGGVVAKEVDSPPAKHVSLRKLLGDFTGEQKTVTIDALLIAGYQPKRPALAETTPEELAGP